MAEAFHLVYITQYFHCLYCPACPGLGCDCSPHREFFVGLYKFAARPSSATLQKIQELGEFYKWGISVMPELGQHVQQRQDPDCDRDTAEESAHSRIH